MRWSVVATVFAKDVLSTLRDRRTLIMSFGLPVLLYPLLMIGASRLQDSQRQTLASRPSRVVIWGTLPAALLDPLQGDASLSFAVPCDPIVCPATEIAQIASGTLSLPPQALDEQEQARRVRANRRRQPASGADLGPISPAGAPDPVTAAAARALATGRVDAVLVAAADLGEAIGQGREGAVTVLYDSVTPASAEARTRLTDRIEDIRQELVAARERDASLPEGFARVVRASVTNAATNERISGFRLGSVLPFLLIALSLLGGLYPAIELTAGEKERGTLQTLLCAPILPLEIVSAKFLAVWVISMTTALVNIASFGLTLSRVLPSQADQLGASTLVTALLMLVPITFTTSAVFLAVATMARDFKDGQNFLTPVFMAVSLPAALTMLPAMTLDAWTAFVPILNLALGIKATLSGQATAELMLLVGVSSTLYAALAIVAAARLFQQEQLLLGSTVSLRGFFAPVRRPDAGPTPGLALGTFAVVLVLQFYASLWLENQSLVTMLLVLQLGLMLAPTALTLVLGRFDAIGALGLRVPGPRAVIGAALVGVSAWTIVTGMVMRVLPPPEGLTRGIEDLLQIQDESVPLVRIWLLAALLPAVCEETLFRGLLQNALARWGARAAILTTAVAFAFAHASIYRVLPTFLVGALLGYVAWASRSLFTSVLAHLLNNGMLLTLARFPALATFAGWETSAAPPWTVVAAGGVMLGVGLWLVGNPTARGDSRNG